MARAIGSLSRIIYDEETTWGEAPSPYNGVTLSSFNYGESLRGTKEELLSDTITGDRSHRDSITGNVSAGGSFPFNLSITGMPTLLKHALGTVVTTGSGPYNHVIKRGPLPVGLHIEKQFTNMNPAQYIVYPGCRVGTLNMTIANTGLVNGTLDVMTKTQGGMSTSSLDATPTDPGHKSIHHKSATTQEGGVTAQLVGFEMSVTNNLDDTDYVLGDDTKQSLDEGKGDATGTATFRFEDDVAYNKWFNDTPSSLKVTLVWPASTGQITFDFPNIVYNGEVGPAIESSQGIVLAMPFRALYDDVQQSDVIITVDNDEPTI